MSETFIELWDRLEAELRSRRGGKLEYGNDLVKAACEEDPALTPFKSELLVLVKLRNLVAHNHHRPLVEPTKAAADLLRSILQLVKLKALDIATSPVFSVAEDAEVETLVATMEREVYTAVPVLRDERIVGVFSEATALRVIAHRLSAAGPKVSRVGDLGCLLDPPDQTDRFAHYRCALPATSATDIFRWFGESTAAGVRLNAVFVTDSGDLQRPPLGVITAWDLRKINPARQTGES